MTQIERLSLEDLVREASKQKAELGKVAENLARVYDAIYQKARRPMGEAPRGASAEDLADHSRRKQIFDETASAYSNLASSGKRLSAMVVQAVRRTSQFDRLLESKKTAAEESLKREEARLRASEERSARRETRQKLEKERFERLYGGSSPSSAEEALIDLYGEE